MHPALEMSKTFPNEEPANFHFRAIYDVGTEPATMARHQDALLPAEDLETIGNSYGKSDPGDPFAAFQFSDNSRWSTTITNGSGLTQGDPTTLRWGFVPDGTSIFGFNGEPTSPSNLIGFMGSVYGVTTNDTIYTDEPWFPLFQSYINRWSQLSGLTYVYEPNDDGGTFGSLPGVIGVRGDVRIGGHLIDGQSNVLAYNFFPNNSDMVIDTGDSTFFGGTANNSRALRNVLAHEHGHGIGLGHVCPVIDGVNGRLMEPFINLSIDGPQFDDILAAQRGYGDSFEKNGGNNAAATATPLGPIASGQTVQRGTNANDNQVVPAEMDFLSVDDDSDLDFFSFTVTDGISLDIALTPLGPTYLSGPQNANGSCSAGATFNASAQSDLTLQLISPNGVTVLQSANLNGLQGAENIVSGPLPAGTYFVRVSGSANAAQMYRLSLAATQAISVVVTQSGGSTDVSESGLTDSYTLGLSTVPAGTVQVTATANSQVQISSDGVNFSSSVTLSLANTTPQTITVRAIDDFVSEGLHTGTITHAISATNDPTGYPLTMPVASITVNIEDNELTQFVRQQPFGSLVSTSFTNPGTIAKASGNVTFSISLEAGQKFSATATPANSAVLRIELVGVTPIFAASNAGAAAVLPVTAIASSGVYSLRVTSDFASSFNLSAVLNAISEVVDSAGDNKLAIDSSALALGGGRYAVIGKAAPVSSPTLQFTKSNNPNLFVDISSTGTDLRLGDDTFAVISTTVGNSIFPAGTATVNNNGLLISGVIQTQLIDNFGLPTGSFGNALVPFWDDIDDETGGVYWQQRQVGGINTLIVQWENRPHFDNSGSTTFQLQLFESGQVLARYVYKDVIFGNAAWNGGASATVGFQQSSNSALQFSFNSASLVDGDVLDLVRPVSPDVDEFSLNLTGQASKPIDIVLAGVGVDFSNQQLQLIGVDGSTVLASGVVDPVQAGIKATNINLGILGFVVPVGGTYTIRTTNTTASGQYVLGVGIALALESEPNNLATNPLRGIASNKPALGFLNVVGDQDDHYSLSLLAGEIVKINTTTPFDSITSSLSNLLNPELTVVHPDGATIVGTDLNSMDGKNALARFTAPITGTYSVRVQATSGSGEYTLAAITDRVGASVFYNDSGFEFFGGLNAAIDDSKRLLSPSTTPQKTSFTNVSGFTKGLNGIMLSLAGLVGSQLNPSDFIFRVAPNDVFGVVNPSTWALAPAPGSINVTAGSTSAPGRVRIEWPDNVLQNTWLQIIVRSNANTGLPLPAVFYVGNALGEVDGEAPYRTTTIDLGKIALMVGNTLVPANEVRDIDKDERITTLDLGYVTARVGNRILLDDIIIPVSGSAAEGASSGAITLPPSPPKQSLTLALLVGSFSESRLDSARQSKAERKQVQKLDVSFSLSRDQSRATATNVPTDFEIDDLFYEIGKRRRRSRQ